ncbi:unnamed protein product, partial [Ectocarpus sp. 12 AP-2014]
RSHTPLSHAPCSPSYSQTGEHFLIFVLPATYTHVSRRSSDLIGETKLVVPTNHSRWHSTAAPVQPAMPRLATQTVPRVPPPGRDFTAGSTKW